MAMEILHEGSHCKQSANPSLNGLRKKKKKKKTEEKQNKHTTNVNKTNKEKTEKKKGDYLLPFLLKVFSRDIRLILQFPC